MPTIDDLERIMSNIERYVQDLPNQLLIRAGQIVIVNGLSDISETLGVITAGEFRTGNQVDPGRGFSGMRMAYPGMTYAAQTWNLVGVNNDVLQVGIRASDGKLVAGGGTVILDSSGITVTDGIDSIIISSSDIHSANYAANLSGFIVKGNGDAEFNNIIARGEIRTSVLTYQEVQAYAGTLGVFKSAGVLLNNVTIPATGTYTIDVRDPAYAHAATFAVGDVLRIKTGTHDTWMTVQAGGVTDNLTYFTYTVLTNSGTTGETYTDGQAVIDYGPSGQGVLMMTADAAGAPYFSVRTHAGSPWSAQTELARLGNLNGYMGYATNIYGLAIGEYAANKPNLTLDPTNGLRIRSYTTNVMRFNTTGTAEIIGTLTISNPGIVSAGADNIRLSSVGLGIVTGGYLNNGINWYATNFSGSIVGSVSSDYSSSNATLRLRAAGTGSGNGKVVLESHGSVIDGDENTYLRLSYQSLLLSDYPSPPAVHFDNTGYERIGMGLVVGSTTQASPGLGNILYTGNLISKPGTTEYTGYIYHPISNPALIVNGTALNTGWYSYSLTALGLPTGIKAVSATIGGCWASANNNYYMEAWTSGMTSSSLIINSAVANINQWCSGTVTTLNNELVIYVAGANMTIAYVKVLGYYL